jgi:hypothetical protein
MCHATKVQPYDAADDPPEGWYRLEDNACVFVVCSIACLKSLIATLDGYAPRATP